MADEVVGEISRLLQMTSQLNFRTYLMKVKLQKLRDFLWILKEFAEQAAGLKQVDWHRQIKDAVYDLEDTIECWLVAEYLSPFIANEWSLAADIKPIRKGRLQALIRRFRAYRDLPIDLEQLEQASEVRPEQLYEEADSSIKQHSIFADETEILIRRLSEKTEKLDVISITGMPGIGKTRLASSIYQNKTIGMNFSTRIWVDIPLDFDRKHLYVDIVNQLILLDNTRGSSSRGGSYMRILIDFAENHNIIDVNLVEAVRSCLEESRFLLVMDGVWTADTLESVVNFLPNNGKVLITSRHNHITRKPHLLRFLNERESWELLQLAVFEKLDGCPDSLMSAGKCIAKNCDGSPLAIAILANSITGWSESASKDLIQMSDADNNLTMEWWKNVSENVSMHVAEYCAHHNVFKSIEMSYIKLPQHLQNCFIYLGVFPEGCEIPISTLTRLWIAEGLVQDTGVLCLEETAEQNLYGLINRNLVLIGKSYPNGQIKTCRVHKLIYGFCKYKAADRDFYHEIKISKAWDLDGPMPLTPKHRRLCIESCLSEFLSSGPKGRCVRAILCLDKGDREIQPKYCSNIHKSFKLLKILECKYIKFAKFPNLRKLVNLRYIALSCDDLVIIPTYITSLPYLETLVVDTQSPSLKLKANAQKMSRLRHLVTNAAIILAIRGEGKAGKNLQTLTRLAPECCTDDLFRRTPKLKKLGIRGQLAALLSADTLRRLEGLEHLKLISESQLNCRLPGQFFPPNINSLTLSATFLKWESMSVLGQMDSLEILKLKNNAFVGESWSTDAGGFHRLGFLHIGTTDLVSWEASSDDCFPRLKWLVLNNCEKLEEIPSNLAKSLDTLEVEMCPKLRLSQPGN